MTPLTLPGTLDLPAAARLHAQLMEARGQDLELDASSVQRLGGQCLQVLLAGHAAWQADGRSFHLMEPSDAFVDAARTMGAGQALGLANGEDRT